MGGAFLEWALATFSGYAAVDEFICGSAIPDACGPGLRVACAAARVEVMEILRGRDA